MITLRKVRGDQRLARFGSTLLSHSGRLFVMGGIARDSMLPADEEIAILHNLTNDFEKERKLSKVHFKGQFPMPLFIGSSISCSMDTIIITGGGAVCFSFGTFWNRGCYTISLQMMLRSEGNENSDSHSKALEPWKYLQTVKSSPLEKVMNNGSGLYTLNEEKALNVVTVERMKASSAYDFAALTFQARPVILEGLNLGSCITAWTSDYLQDHVGRDKKVCLDCGATP
jgi:tRNA wybutosine-synthesizing protein 4